MYGSVAGPSGSRNRKTNPNELKFTYRDVKKVLKSNGPKGESATLRRDRLADERIKNDTKRLLTRFGVGPAEQETFVSLGESCGAGRLLLNKHSLKTLFGDEDATTGFGYGEEDDYDTRTIDRRSGAHGRRVRFLRSTDETFGKSTRNEVAPKHVYFLTLAVGTSAALTGPRKPNTVYLQLPPKNGDRKAVDKPNLLADLMVMTLYFVADYVYRTLREEISHTSAQRTAEPTEQRLRYPVILVRQIPQTNGGASKDGAWYKCLKEKLAKGEDVYARRLALNYNCNVI